MARAMAGAPTRVVERRRRLTRGSVLLWIIAVVATILVLLPLAFMVSASFTPESLVEQWPLTPWPKSPTLANYQALFAEPDIYIGRWYLNSIVISCSVTFLVLVLVLSSVTAYGFARLQFPGRDWLLHLPDHADDPHPGHAAAHLSDDALRASAQHLLGTDPAAVGQRLRYLLVAPVFPLLPV